MARVIEEKIIERIHTWKEGNYSLSVRDKVKIEGNKAIYYLRGSPVVTIHKETDGKKYLRFCFCGHASQTTKERISELLWAFSDKSYIFRRNWIHYLKMNNNYYKINESYCYTIKDGILYDSKDNKVESLKNFKE